MFTVVETPLFQKQWPLYWTEEERGAFAAFLAEHPNQGDCITVSIRNIDVGSLKTRPERTAKRQQQA